MFSSLLSASSQAYVASRTLLMLSIFVAVFSTIVYAVKMRRFKAPGRLSFTGYILSVTLVSLLLLQISLAISASPEAKDGIAANYSVTQRITYSIQNTLQFFSLDADYTEIIGKGEEVYNSVVFAKIYAVYGTLCTIAIPVIGLSVIFDILIAFIPGVKFFISFKNTKIIFSELNEKSIEVAESIAKKSFILRHYRRYKKYKEFCEQSHEEDMPLIKRVCFRYLKWLFSEIDPDEEIQDNYAELRWAQIVFTDVYPDKMSEGKSELLDRAKLIGAICLKKDLLDRSVHFLCCPAMCSHLIYMLMDFEEENNFDSAVALMSEKQGLWAKTLGFVKNPRRHKEAIIYSDVREENNDKDGKPMSKDAIVGVLVKAIGSDRQSEGEENQSKYAVITKEPLKRSDLKCYTEHKGRSRLKDKVKLAKAFRSNKIVFSELNKTSIAVAEEVVKSNEVQIIFNDQCPEKDDKEKPGYIERAEKIGAVCLKTRSQERCRIKGYITVYAFTRHPNAAKMISGSAPSHPHINIQTVNEYRNLVYSLIKGYDYENNEGRDRENYPLYYHLIEKVERLKKDIAAGNKATGALPDVKEKGNSADAEAAADVLCKDRAEDSINIVIVGGGKIGGEFLRAALWCSQILSFRSKDEILAGEPANTIPVRITLIADNALDFKKRMNFEMPALKEFDATDSPSKKAAKEPTLIFRQAVFGSSDFEAVFDEEALDGHYFLVSLGDDYLNDAAAQWIKGRLKRDVDRAESTASIHYAIYNDDICRKLRMEESKNEGGSALYKKRKVVMHPFGSLRQFFNYSNICLNELDDKARYVHAAQSGENKLNPIIDDYAKQSSMANALHYEYKLFGTDMAYLNTVSGNDKLRYIKAIFDRQYWLEHWRWYLYMVTCGYRCPTVKEFLYLIREDNAYKYSSEPLNIVKDKYEGAEHRDKMLELQGCMVEGKEHYMQTQAWVTEVGDTVGKQVFENEFYNRLHASFKAVVYGKAQQNDKMTEALADKNPAVSLGNWLKWLFEVKGKPLYVENDGKRYELDGLDALSLAMTIIKEKSIDGRPTNFKNFDIATIRRIMSAMTVEETEKALKKAIELGLEQNETPPAIMHLKEYLNDLIDYSIGIDDQIIKVKAEGDGYKREFSYCHIRHSKANGYGILIRFEGEAPTLYDNKIKGGVTYLPIDKQDKDGRIIEKRLFVAISERGETNIASWAISPDQNGVDKISSAKEKKAKGSVPNKLQLVAYFDEKSELQFKLKAVYERKISDNKK